MKLSPSRLLPAVVAACLLLAVTACGGDDDDSADSDLGIDVPTESDDAAEGTTTDDTPEDDSTDDDASEADEPGSEVCDLLTDEEIADAVGFDVVDKTAETSALPSCEWELDTSSAETANIPVFSMVLLPEDEYQARAEPMRDLTTPVDGAGDEALIAFSAVPNVPAMIQFLAIDGDQGVHFLPGVHQWDHDQAAAEAALVELANLVFKRA